MQSVTTSLTAGLVLALTSCASGPSIASQQRTLAVGTCDSQRDTAAEARAIIAAGKAERVEPVRSTMQHPGGGMPLQMVGAELTVPAEPGLREPYIERVLSCYASTVASTNPGDPLQMDDIGDVSVRSTGDSFRVIVVGIDVDSGDEIGRRARALRNTGPHRVALAETAIHPVRP